MSVQVIITLIQKEPELCIVLFYHLINFVLSLPRI